ncbi:MAG: sugar phosphate isomerase/epimerase [Clostridia bacterium]|nr:sugar phosphate isomerase/epimerase [Clostridia bacterium]
MNQKICFYTKPYKSVKNFYDFIDVTVESGLSAIEATCNMDFAVPDIEVAKKIKAYADSKGVVFTCFSIWSNLVGEDARQQIDRMKQYAEIAAAIGSPYLHHTIVGECCEPDNVLPKKEEYFNEGIQAVREIYDYAKKCGVRTVYEDQGYIFNGVTTFKRFLQEVNRDVGVVADLGNIYMTNEKIEDFIQEFSDKIVNVHFKDLTVDEKDISGSGLKSLRGGYMNCCEIGKGIVNFKTCIDMIKKMGYDGFYAIEYGNCEDESPVIKDILNRVDNWLK